MIPVFHPAAETELAAAMEIGEERGSGLGAELLSEVRRIVEASKGVPGAVPVSIATMVWITALVIGLMLLYADVLASFVILRDRELSRLTWILRLLFVWCVPFLGAVLALRVSSEESPDLLPSRRWLWPFLPLLSDRPDSFAGNEVIDLAGESARSLPGQVGDFNVGAFNAAAGDSSGPGGDHGGSE